MMPTLWAVDTTGNRVPDSWRQKRSCAGCTPDSLGIAFAPNVLIIPVINAFRCATSLALASMPLKASGIFAGSVSRRIRDWRSETAGVAVYFGSIILPKLRKCCLLPVAARQLRDNLGVKVSHFCRISKLLMVFETPSASFMVLNIFCSRLMQRTISPAFSGLANAGNSFEVFSKIKGRAWSVIAAAASASMRALRGSV